MNTNAVKTVAQKAFGRTGLLAKKHSPVILSTVGVVGVVTTVVLASKATLKLEQIVDDSNNYLEIAKQHKDAGNINEKEYKREVTALYISTGAKIAKLYAPAFTLGVASIGCLLGAQGILQKRNVALAAAYKSLEQGFNEYRKRVVDALGVDKEAELYRDRLFVEREVVNVETGEITKEKSFDPTGVSQYARFFDELSPEWQRQPEYNQVFLNNIQRNANDMLKARGHLFLNEVYDMLGLERTKAGQVVGWLMDPNGDGDNYVSFGIYEFNDERHRAFVNGDEHSVLLDFNVDGTIFDKI